MTGDAHTFKVGDKVLVRWMSEPVEATILTRYHWGKRPHKMPLYGLTIPGVSGTLSYRQDELEPAPSGCGGGGA